MRLSDRLSLFAIFISIISLFGSGFIGYWFANKSFEKQRVKLITDDILSYKKKLISNLENFNLVITQVAVSEYSMSPDNLGVIPIDQREAFWEKCYDGHDMKELNVIIGNLLELSFDELLKGYNIETYNKFMSLSQMRTNSYMPKYRISESVHLISNKGNFISEIKNLENDFIYNFLVSIQVK